MNTKKLNIIFIILCVVISFPTICFANYFDDNSKRYVCYQNDERFKSYLDLNSVTAVRYDPPYYSIDADIITFDYIGQIGCLYHNRFFYNYNTKEILSKNINMYPCYENGYTDKSYDYGISLTSSIPIKLYSDSAGYLGANLAFLKCYNMIFYYYY